MLRLTGEFADSIVGYPIHPSTAGDVFEQLVDWLTDLDKGWYTVLSSEAWDPNSKTGLVLTSALSRPISATDKIRLRSILRMSKDKISEWLTNVGQLEPGTQIDIAASFHRTLGSLGDAPGVIVDLDIGEDEDAEELLEIPIADNPDFESS